jgi:hypothetical protein
MSHPLAPTPDEIADSAVAAAAEAFDSVKAFTAGIASNRIRDASLMLHEAGSASTAGPSDQDTWIRQAAMMLLVGVQALSDEEGTEVDRDDDEHGDDVGIEEAWRLLAQGRLADAEALADVLLDRANLRDPADAGDLVHHGHLIHGHASLRRGDVATAEEHLLAAADLVASPTLASFGPNTSLARALLLRDSRERVLDFFDRCALFWGQLPLWRADVLAGQMPRFGPNLVYGLPDDVHAEILGSTD